MRAEHVVLWLVGCVVVVWLVGAWMADPTLEPSTPITPIGYSTPVGSR